MKSSFYSDALNELKNRSQFREIKDIRQDGKYIILNGKRLLNFSSNDYLGLSYDTKLQDEFLTGYIKSGHKISTPSARLLCGTDTVYWELEEYLAKMLAKEKALLFNSGYHGNVGIYSSLVNTDDVVFADKLNHASIIDGIRLSKAKIIPYKHLDYEDLRHKLQRYRKQYKKAVISSESLFSMDGDVADINVLVSLKKEFDTLLIVDEAHSFGVYGGGRGISYLQGALSGVDLILATFGKAAGSYGAFAAGSVELIEYLVNFARPFIFSTSFPQISAAFSYYVLQNVIFKNNTLQDKLFRLSELFRNSLCGYKIPGESYIAPVILGENELSVRFSNYLIENGFYILPIRYPTVAKNTARLRISLNAGLDEADITSLCDCLKAYRA